jgi:hypothetical protein
MHPQSLVMVMGAHAFQLSPSKDKQLFCWQLASCTPMIQRANTVGLAGQQVLVLLGVASHGHPRPYLLTAEPFTGISPPAPRLLCPFSPVHAMSTCC